MSKTSAEKYKLTQSQTLSIQLLSLSNLILMLQELTSVPLSTGFVCLLEELKSMSAPLGVLPDLQAMAAWLKVVG